MTPKYKINSCPICGVEIPQTAIYCPNCGKILVTTPQFHINKYAVDEVKKSIEMNPFLAKEVICDLLSLSHHASMDDIIFELRNRIQ